METPFSSDVRSTEQILDLIVSHYARTRISDFDTLSVDVQVQLQNDTHELEREVHRRESPRGFPLIRELCSSAKATDRFAAIMVLYRCEHGQDLQEASIHDLLLKRLEAEDDPEVLNQLILWFRYRHKDERAVPVLCRLRGHPDYMVRTCVADALGAYQGNPDARMALHTLSMDVHANVRESAEEELRIKVRDLLN